tara:strand:+ start:66444 stop:67283 length:840 start_codon:yes stop_codon:yes gene_type:complete
VEAQVEKTTTAKPQAIVEQLLDIAKNNDAMDVIGGSTSWRWQEGLITRMPKTKTVAAILTKAFNSEDPNVWINQIGNGELLDFLKGTFKARITTNIDLGEYIQDIYDSLFIMLAMKKSGVLHSEVLYNFSYFKYASSFENTEYFEIPTESALFTMYGKWAVSKLESILNKCPTYKLEGDRLRIEESQITSELHTQNILEISKLRNKMIGFNSKHDMWRTAYIDLTDEEHIYLERQMLDYYKNLLEDLKTFSKSSFQHKKTRAFSISSFTLPQGKMEGMS